MSYEKNLVIVIIACVTFAVVAKPNPTPMDYKTARNQTVCRTKVRFDTDLDRIPKTIKFIECADDPYKMCPKGDKTMVACCGAGAASFSCTEVQDDVMVKRVVGMKDDVIKAAIGCACIELSINTATAV